MPSGLPRSWRPSARQPWSRASSPRTASRGSPWLRTASDPSCWRTPGLGTGPRRKIQGYRRALELIHASPQDLAITPELLQRLHALIQEGSGDDGQWRKVDNEIVELREGAPPVVRFRPVGVAETPAAV